MLASAAQQRGSVTCTRMSTHPQALPTQDGSPQRMSWSPRAAQLPVVTHLLHVRQPQSPSAPRLPSSGSLHLRTVHSMTITRPNLVFNSLIPGSPLFLNCSIVLVSASRGRTWVGDSGAPCGGGDSYRGFQSWACHPAPERLCDPAAVMCRPGREGTGQWAGRGHLESHSLQDWLELDPGPPCHHTSEVVPPPQRGGQGQAVPPSPGSWSSQAGQAGPCVHRAKPGLPALYPGCRTCPPQPQRPAPEAGEGSASFQAAGASGQRWP